MVDGNFGNVSYLKICSETIQHKSLFSKQRIIERLRMLNNYYIHVLYLIDLVSQKINQIYIFLIIFPLFYILL